MTSLIASMNLEHVYSASMALTCFLISMLSMRVYIIELDLSRIANHCYLFIRINEMISRLVFISTLIASIQPQSWKDCGPEDAKVRFADITVAPDPLVFGKTARINALVMFKGRIDSGFLALDVARVITVFGFPFSLKLGCTNGYGGCTKDLCTDLKESEMLCSWLKSSNSTCECPKGPGVIVTRDYDVVVPKLSDLVAMFASVSLNVVIT